MTKNDIVKLKDLILKKRKENKIVFMTIEGPMEIDIDEFIKQPIEGILYDLNRDFPTILTFLNAGNLKWINDFAVAMVISKLKEHYDKNKGSRQHDKERPD